MYRLSSTLLNFWPFPVFKRSFYSVVRIPTKLSNILGKGGVFFSPFESIFCSKSRWSKATSSMHIQVITSPECTSIGDALRDIDTKAIIQGDFILVSGDVVSNMNLSRALATHRERRKVDKNMIMTMVLKPSTPLHRSRERCESAVFCIDPVSQECIHYESIDSEMSQGIAVKLESVLLESHRAIDIRYDLIDCQIDICSLNVLALFTENFDYQDMRKDFVRGILQCDILGHKIGFYELAPDEYAARVRSSHLYDSVSRDIIARWTFPIVPDMNLLEDQELTIKRGNRYMGRDVMLSRSAEIGPNTVLGAGVTVGEGTTITRSVIGSNVSIGPNCRIDGAYIWDSVMIEGDSIIESSIIADNVRIRSGVVINRGCMVTSNVSLGPKANIPANSRVAKWSDHLERALTELNLTLDGEGEDNQIATSLNELSASSRAILGADSDGLLWTAPMLYDPENPDDSIDLSPALVEERTAAFTIGSDFHRKPLNLPSDDESEGEGQDEHVEEVSIEEGEDYDEDYGFGSDSGAHEKFYEEAFEMTRQSILSSYTIDNTSLELNALKFACNASFSDCRRAVICAIASLIDPTKMAASVSELLGTWATLLSKFIHSPEDQADVIRHLHVYLQSTPSLSLAFHVLLPQLYKLDVLEDESILEWYEETAAKQAEGENYLFCRQIKGFVNWLDESEEESDDEDDEEEDEEGDSDSE
jgi:translation initiation factor eIF-2B subunit epsilon